MRNAMFAAAALLAGLAAPASAATVFSDNFNGENGGASYLNYGTSGGTSFANFAVSQGQVDLIRSGDFGLTCAGGTGSCVDLQGTRPGRTDGRLTSIQSFAFAAGDIVTLSFLMSGNQRPNADPNGDHFMVVFDFGGTVAMSNIVINNGVNIINPSNTGPTTQFTYGSGTVPANEPFLLRSVSFQVDRAGTVRFGIQGDDIAPTPQVDDDFGLILDNVTLDIGAAAVPGVPEPATWAMLLLGFGAIGSGLRRRTRSPRIRFAA